MNILESIGTSLELDAPVDLGVQPAPSTLEEPVMEVLSSSFEETDFRVYPFRQAVAILVEDTVYGEEDEIINLNANEDRVVVVVRQSYHMNLLTVVIRYEGVAR